MDMKKVLHRVQSNYKSNKYTSKQDKVNSIAAADRRRQLMPLISINNQTLHPATKNTSSTKHTEMNRSLVLKKKKKNSKSRTPLRGDDSLTKLSSGRQLSPHHTNYELKPTKIIKKGRGLRRSHSKKRSDMIHSENHKIIHDRRKQNIRTSKETSEKKKKENESNKNSPSNNSPSAHRTSMYDYKSQSNFFRNSVAEKIDKMSTEEFVAEVKENSPEQNFHMYNEKPYVRKHFDEMKHYCDCSPSPRKSEWGGSVSNRRSKRGDHTSPMKKSNKLRLQSTHSKQSKASRGIP